jgi:hypothetical protein
MQVFAQDDLNDDLSSSSSQIQNTNSDNFFAGFSFDTDLIDSIVKNVNLFVLAWSIFYTIVFLSHFFYHRLFYSKGKLLYEKRGMNAITRLLGFWWRYIFCLIFLVVYGFLRKTDFAFFVGILTIFIYIIKVYIDLGKMFDILTYHSWLKSFGESLKKVLRLN